MSRFLSPPSLADEEPSGAATRWGPFADTGRLHWREGEKDVKAAPNSNVCPNTVGHHNHLGALGARSLKKANGGKRGNGKAKKGENGNLGGLEAYVVVKMLLKLPFFSRLNQKLSGTKVS